MAKTMAGQMGKNYKILSLEAKDIFDQMQTKGGYFLPDKKQGKKGSDYYRKFVNTLDWSLDSEKLEQVWTKTNRKKRFGFCDDNGKNYTLAVINVKFSFEVKEFNKTGNVFVKNGCSFVKQDFACSKHVVDENGKLVAIKIGVPEKQPLPQDVLLPYFAFDSQTECYARTEKKIKTVLSTTQLRKKLYDEGFVCEGKQYVRYKRSSGSSREGTCLFVEQPVFKKMDKWSCCGLAFKEGEFDKTSWEAYKALSLSSIIGMVDIPLDKILFIDDFKSVFAEKALAVATNENNELTVEQKEVVVSNDIWDGESLLDESVFLSQTQGADISQKSMLLLRNNFFKTCAFRTKLQQWFADNNADIALVKKHGVTLANDVKDIVMVTTPSSLKYIKFAGGVFDEKTIRKWADNVGGKFGIVKYNKKTPYFNGDMVQSSYQLINTVQLSSNEASQLVQPSAQYLSLVRSDSAVMAFHVFERISKEKSLWKEKGVEHEQNFETKAEIIMRLLGKNKIFDHTEVFRNFKYKLTNEFRQNLKKGHILLPGTYATLFGNGTELLMATVGKFDRQKPVSVLPKGQISCKKFAYGKTLVGARSPHITMGNLLVAQNVQHPMIDKYFVLADEIVCVNAIGENVQQRLNGCDYDSDTMLLTDDNLVVKKAKINYDKFLVPVCEVLKEKADNIDLATLDHKISVNKIGEVVNLSQRLNSLYWDLCFVGKTKQAEQVYEDICKLAILSGIEIDKAKRKYKVDVAKELFSIAKTYKNKSEFACKPRFFVTIDEENKQFLQYKKDDCYCDYNTAMDFVWKHVDNISFLKGKEKRMQKVDIISFIEKPKGTAKKADYLHKDKIMQIVCDFANFAKKQRQRRQKADEQTCFAIDEQIALHRQSCHKQVNELCTTKHTVWLVAKELDKSENSSIRSYLFEMLFEKQNKIANEMFVLGDNENCHLVRSPGGEISLYGISYSKTCKK